jgi:hypothetical protein
LRNELFGEIFIAKVPGPHGFRPRAFSPERFDMRMEQAKGKLCYRIDHTTVGVFNLTPISARPGLDMNKRDSEATGNDCPNKAGVGISEYKY